MSKILNIVTNVLKVSNVTKVIVCEREERVGAIPEEKALSIDHRNPLWELEKLHEMTFPAGGIRIWPHQLATVTHCQGNVFHHISSKQSPAKFRVWHEDTSASVMDRIARRNKLDSAKFKLAGIFSHNSVCCIQLTEKTVSSTIVVCGREKKVGYSKSSAVAFSTYQKRKAVVTVPYSTLQEASCYSIILQ